MRNGWVWGAMLGLGCGVGARPSQGGGFDSLGAPGTSVGTEASGSAMDDAAGLTDGRATEGGSTAGRGSGDAADGASGDPGAVFDVAGHPDLDPMISDDECQKIDFLFVIDNSASMTDEQQALVASVPGFIATIESTVNAQNYQLMVVDTDEGSPICTELCTVLPNCFGTPCSAIDPPTACDLTLGAGIVNNAVGVGCGFAGGNRYITDARADLAAAFSCAGLVGAGGQDGERPMESMVEAVTTEVEAGGCNTGFIRDDALLVVTFITDEEDDGDSQGDPASWKQALLSAKGGNEQAIIVLGLVGDGDVPGGGCGPLSIAEPAPILRSFAESFEFGAWASVCSASYAPFFADAVSTIDGACEIFEPRG